MLGTIALTRVIAARGCPQPTAAGGTRGGPGCRAIGRLATRAQLGIVSFELGDAADELSEARLQVVDLGDPFGESGA